MWRWFEGPLSGHPFHSGGKAEPAEAEIISQMSTVRKLVISTTLIGISNQQAENKIRMTNSENLQAVFYFNMESVERATCYLHTLVLSGLSSAAWFSS